MNNLRKSNLAIHVRCLHTYRTGGHTGIRFLQYTPLFPIIPHVLFIVVQYRDRFFLNKIKRMHPLLKEENEVKIAAYKILLNLYLAVKLADMKKKEKEI